MKRFIQIFLTGIFCMGVAGLQAKAFDRIETFADEVPGIGLIADSITFDGITIGNFRFENEKKFVFAEPGDEVPVYMHYEIDASALKTLHLHHLIIGLYDDGPQTCVLHSLGIKDSEGEATVTLKAPEKKGVYQVRFCHSIGLTDHEAQKAWWRGDGPSAKTIVGIMVVK